MFGQQAHFDTWCVDDSHHSIQDYKFSSVSGHAVLFVDNGESFTNETVEEAAFATIGQADQWYFELFGFFFKDIPVSFGLFFGFALMHFINLLWGMEDQLFGFGADAESIAEMGSYVGWV